MTLRENINKSPALKFGFPAIVGLLVVASFFWQRQGGTGELKSGWFTTDDGKTYFADNIQKIPPFQKDGKTAYGCQVFACDDEKAPFVGYLVRFRPQAVAEFAALGTPPGDGAASQDYFDRRNAIEIRTREVKRPLTGDAGWALARASSEGAAITTVRCPTSGGAAHPILP